MSDSTDVSLLQRLRNPGEKEASSMAEPICSPLVSFCTGHPGAGPLPGKQRRRHAAGSHLSFAAVAAIDCSADPAAAVGLRPGWVAVCHHQCPESILCQQLGRACADRTRLLSARLQERWLKPVPEAAKASASN